MCCFARASLDEDEAIGLAEEDALLLRFTSEVLLCEKAREAPRCRFRIGADMACEWELLAM